MIVGELPPVESGAGEKNPPCSMPFVLSGDSDRALRARARSLRRFLDTHGDLDLSHLAFSLAVTATARAHRAAVVTSDRSHLARALSALTQGGSPAGTLHGVAGAGCAKSVPESDRHPDSPAWLAARSYVAGAAVDWAAVFADRDVRPVDLPAPVPLSERYWLAELAAPRRADPSAAATTSEPFAGPESNGDFEQPPSALRERLSQLPASARRGALLDVVRTLAAEVLERDALRGEPGERSFQQLGFDSLTAVEFRDRLGTATGVRLSATAIFDHPSPAALADHLGAEIDWDPTGAAAVALAALDALENAIAALGQGDGGDADEARSVLAGRLAALLTTMAPGSGGGRAPDAQDDIDFATSDEMLAYLDQKLGSR